MNTLAMQTARAAGFLTQQDRLRQTTQNVSLSCDVFGVKFLTSPLMPDGYFALQTSKGVMIVPPGRAPYFIPIDQDLACAAAALAGPGGAA